MTQFTPGTTRLVGLNSRQLSINFEIESYNLSTLFETPASARQRVDAYRQNSVISLFRLARRYAEKWIRSSSSATAPKTG